MRRKLVIYLFFSLVFAGCSPPQENLTPLTPTTNITLAQPMPTAAPVQLAAILLEEGEVLNVHLAADKESAVIETLAANAIQITHTGQEELNGEELWVEIKASTGEAGWINARYLTEYISTEEFCADSHIRFLLDDFHVALKNKDGDLLSSLVSPTHGLDLRYYRYGTLANYTPEEAAWAFKSEYAVNWGNEPGSGFEKIGTFSEIPLPMLLEVLDSNYELYCNDAGIAATFAPEPWLFEYQNINFYQIFKPGTEQYSGMDWRSWLVGVEYIKGKPYLFALIHFEWEP